MTHTELCKKTAERFVKSMAIYESTFSVCEKPDVLNFDSSGFTQLFEIKMSRSDFLADRKKYAREHPHFGNERYFVCYGDFIKEDEVPQGWGLYHYKNNKFYKIKDSIQFVPKWENFTEGLDSEKAKEVSTIYRYATAILVNNILCKKTNVVFSKRVLEYRNKL